VGNLNGPTIKGGTPRTTVTAGTNWILAGERFKLRRRVVGADRPQQLAIKPKDECPVRTAQPYRTFRNGFKDRLKIECRPADDLKHIGWGRLLLQGFGALAGQTRGLGI